MTHVLSDIALPFTLPEHRDLVVASTTGEHWLSLYTADGVPADFTIEWREVVIDLDSEVSHEPRLEVGTFATLGADLAHILEHPHRSADAVVTLDVSAWALHYRAGRA